MTPTDPRAVGAALLALLVAQAGALGSLRDDGGPRRPTLARCGVAVPPVEDGVGLDAALRVRPDLPAGGSGSGTVVLQNNGARPLVVRATQAVLLPPSGREPASTPEPPREVELLLEPGQLTRQDLSLDLRGCGGGPVAPGFYEVAVVVDLVAHEADGRRVESLVTARRAVVVQASNTDR